MFRSTAIIVAAFIASSSARKVPVDRNLAAPSAALEPAFDKSAHEARIAHNGYGNFGGAPPPSNTAGPYSGSDYPGGLSGGYEPVLGSDAGHFKPVKGLANAYYYPYYLGDEGKPINLWYPPKDIQKAESVKFCARKDVRNYAARDESGYYASTDTLYTYDGGELVGNVIRECWTDSIYFSKCSEWLIFGYAGKKPFSVLYIDTLEDIRGDNPHNFAQFCLGTSGYFPICPYIAGVTRKYEKCETCDYYLELSYVRGFDGYDPTYPTY